MHHSSTHLSAVEMFPDLPSSTFSMTSQSISTLSVFYSYLQITQLGPKVHRRRPVLVHVSKS